jgi:hypothetical protein
VSICIGKGNVLLPGIFNLTCPRAFMYVPTYMLGQLGYKFSHFLPKYFYLHSILCSERGFVVRPVLSAAYCESSKFRRFLTLASVPILRGTSQKALIELKEFKALYKYR